MPGRSPSRRSVRDPRRSPGGCLHPMRRPDNPLEGLEHREAVALVVRRHRRESTRLGRDARASRRRGRPSIRIAPSSSPRLPSDELDRVRLRPTSTARERQPEAALAFAPSSATASSRSWTPFALTSRPTNRISTGSTLQARLSHRAAKPGRQRQNAQPFFGQPAGDEILPIELAVAGDVVEEREILAEEKPFAGLPCAPRAPGRARVVSRCGRSRRSAGRRGAGKGCRRAHRRCRTRRRRCSSAELRVEQQVSRASERECPDRRDRSLDERTNSTLWPVFLSERSSSSLSHRLYEIAS